jgi:Aph-1 protein
MTQAALTVGSFFLAYGPLLSLFALIVYHKAQLVILVTTSAFFFLLAATASSMTWFIFHAAGLNGPLVAILPSVFFQFLFRCAFTALYHKVERVIQLSLEKQHEEELKMQQQQQQDSSDSRLPGVGTWTEAARLRLELNDGSAAIAAAVGFGGMHAVLLYGTLLASETSNNVGVLYQESCPAVPSLTVSAIITNFFSILQVFWMLLTFFGMRRRLMFHRGQSAASATFGSEGDATVTTRAGSYLGNSRNGGNWALLLTLVTHFLAALLTTANGYGKGCLVSLPGVGGTVILTAYLFWAGCGRIYMPPPQPQELADDHRD